MAPTKVGLDQNRTDVSLRVSDTLYFVIGDDFHCLFWRKCSFVRSFESGSSVLYLDGFFVPFHCFGPKISFLFRRFSVHKVEQML